MAELWLFDFDGTLFRSPHPPSGWPETENDWFGDEQSLSPPYVPDRPGPNWWSAPTVEAAAKGIASPDIYVLCATGRQDKIFRGRVWGMLLDKGLHFDEIHLNPGTATPLFKKTLLLNTLRKLPKIIDRVQLWDNEQEHLNTYGGFLQRLGLEVISHLVETTPMPAESPFIEILPNKRLAMSKADLESRLRLFQQALAQTKPEMEQIRARTQSATEGVRERLLKIWSKAPWFPIANAGEELHKAIMLVKRIPVGKEKALEMAGRPFYKTRPTLDILTWYADNQKYFNFLIEAATTWPDRGETDSTTEGVFKVGPFRVLNMVGASGKPLEGTLNALESAVLHMPMAPIPDAGKVLYGDVQVVGKIKQERALAWYYREDDLLYVRPLLDEDLPHNICHELAHRYWGKFMSDQAKMKWRGHHTMLSWKHVPFHMEVPKPGDRLEAVSGNPTVTRSENGNVFYLGKEGKEQAVRFERLWDWGARGAELTKYPSPYSSKSAEEHFAEAVAFAAFGKLTPEHLTELEACFK